MYWELLGDLTKSCVNLGWLVSHLKGEETKTCTLEAKDKALLVGQVYVAFSHGFIY